MSGSQAEVSFHHQSMSDAEEAGMCAFFSSRHFLGALDRDDFFARAGRKLREIMPEATDAEIQGFILDGNDPAVIPDVIGGEFEETSNMPDMATRPETNRILIALKNKAHFITVRKRNGRWTNYDSLQMQPAPISDIQAFLTVNPGQRWWLGS